MPAKKAIKSYFVKPDFKIVTEPVMITWCLGGKMLTTVAEC